MAVLRPVSLGWHCQAAHQLDRIVGQDRPSGFFDWLITPHEGLIALLDARFEGLLASEHLDVVGVHRDHHHVIDRHYGIEWLHAFPLDRAIGAALPDVQAKYRMLAARFLAMTGRRHLFVRQVEPADCRADHAQAIVARLIDLCGPGFRLLMVTERLPDPLWSVPGVQIVQVAQPDPYVWTGLDAEWDRAMNAAGISAR